MERLVYRSIAAPDLESAAIFEIVETSARKNPSREITGFLIHDEGRFLQLVEGPSESLDDLLVDLGNDPRHSSIEVLERAEASQRFFPNWRMKRLISFSSMPAVDELRSVLTAREGGPAILALVEDFLAA